MSELSHTQDDVENTEFWKNATRYAIDKEDELFVGEMAYLMVTLHRTGA